MSAVLRPALPALPRIALPPSTLTVGVIAFAYALPGLFGHDPWKPEDAIGIGVVHQMLEAGRWLLPGLAGEVYTEDGPLYYWAAAAFAFVLGPFLGIDDAARLASALAVIATLFLLRAAGRELYGRSPADGAMLVLLGTLGLLIHAHESLGELGMLAGQAMAWHGIALAPRKPDKAGLAIGLGLAMALLSKGPWGIIAPALTALLLPVLCGHWRTWRFARTLLEALGAFALPVAVWSLAVATRAPAEAAAWLAAQWQEIGVPSWSELAYDLKTLSWAAWPAWPIAAWLLWERRHALREPGLLFGTLATVVSLLAVLLLKGTREVHILALLPALSLIAGAGVERLRRGAVSALEWFGAITFTFFGALVWLGWFAMMTGVPSRIAHNFAKLEPGHVPVFEWLPFVLALLFTAAWLIVICRSDRSPYRCVLFWACGATLLWALIMTLLLAWIDYGKSYAPVAQGLASAIRKADPRGTACIESRGLGQSQRGALDYHAGIVTLRAEVHGETGCRLLLLQGSPDDDGLQSAAKALGGEWKRVWEGNRPRDKERYHLYVRTR